MERTLAWLAKYRRLTIRYERHDDIHEAFLSSWLFADLPQLSFMMVLKGSLSRPKRLLKFD